MTRDLGADAPQVHVAAEQVLAFWLVEVPAEKRFARDDALDATIAARFGDLARRVVADGAAGWRGSPRTLLAAIVLADQFSRNLWRGDPRAYAADPLARALAREAVTKGWGRGLSEEERQFLHMPFMHSESMADQVTALRLFGADNGWAAAHAGQIARFGRFPQRNAVLGRETTPAEAEFLSDPANHF